MTIEEIQNLNVGDRIEFSAATQKFVGTDIDWTAGVVTRRAYPVANRYWHVPVMPDPAVFPAATDRGQVRSADLVRRRARNTPRRRGTSGYSPFAEA